MMNKRLFRNIIISIVLIILLGGGYYMAVKWEPIKQESDNTADVNSEIKLIEFAKDELESVDITNESSSFRIREADSGYTVEGYENIEFDASLDSLVSALSCLTAERIIKEDVYDAEEYGLKNPSAVIEIKLKDGKIFNISVGNEAPAGNGYYVLVNDVNTVYMVSESIGACMYGIDNLRSDTVMTMDIESLSELEIEKDGKQIVLIRSLKETDKVMNMSMEPLVMEYPYYECVKKNVLDEAIEIFGSLKALSIAEENCTDLSEYGIGNYTIKLTDDSKEHILKIGSLAPDGGVYVQYGTGNTVFIVDENVYNFVSGFEPFDYIYKFVQLYDIDEVSEIKYDIGGVSYVCKTDNHTVNGKDIGENNFKKIYQKIIGICFTAPYNGQKYGKEAGTVTMTFKNGSSTARYYEYDDRNYAVVRDDGTTYLILRKNVLSAEEEIDGIIE